MRCLGKMVGTLVGLVLLPIGMVLLVLPGPGLLVLAAAVGVLWLTWRPRKAKTDDAP